MLKNNFYRFRNLQKVFSLDFPVQKSLGCSSEKDHLFGKGDFQGEKEVDSERVVCFADVRELVDVLAEEDESAEN